MKAYEVMAALANLPCNADVHLCNMVTGDKLQLNGCFDRGDDFISFEVDVYEGDESEES